VHLDNLAALCRAGAVILPAMPSFYSKPKTLNDVIDTVISRVLDHLEISHCLSQRWGQS
jgi:4-hydroxy-3-polyprenylbenzoate decarboxylase